MAKDKKYGIIKRKSKSSKKKGYFIIAAASIWGLVVMSWATQSVALMLGYHKTLGKPLFQAFERLWYWPWQIVSWAFQFQGEAGITKIIEKAQLAFIAPLILAAILFLAAGQKLKGREDLHGSAKWAEHDDIKNMGYLEGQGVYVGGWWDAKAHVQRYLRHNGPEHILCFAPTRSGKGVGLILPTLPTLLSWPHSSLVFDIKVKILL